MKRSFVISRSVIDNDLTTTFFKDSHFSVASSIAVSFIRFAAVVIAEEFVIRIIWLEFLIM